jgi:tetratricopeptide (TPR) repeat protein
VPAAASTIPAADPVGGELAACFEQGLALLESQAWAPALASFSRGLEIDPGRPGLWHNRAWCHLQLGDLAAAQADLQALLEHAPGHAPGLALLGRVRLAQGAIEEGSRLLDLAWMADPADPDIARQALQALLLRPDGESAAARRATILARSGQLDRASLGKLYEVLSLSEPGQEALCRLWAELCTSAQAEPWMFGAWGHLCQRARRFDEAALAATLWVRHDPSSDAARGALMAALCWRGDFAAALPLAIERARKHPRDVAAMAEVSFLLTETRDEAQRNAGLNVLAQALSVAPENPRPWLLRAHYRAKVFLHQEALEDFRRALQIDARLVSAVCGAASSLAALCRHEEAWRELEGLVATDAQASLQRDCTAAFILRTEGRVQEAESMLRGCVDRGCAAAQWDLACLLLLQGRYAEGWSLWRTSSESSRPRALWHRMLGLGARPWDGDVAKARDRVLAVISDGGLGDALQFARFLPALQSRGVKVVLYAQDAIRRLLGRLDPRIEVLGADDGAAPARADLVCSLWDLPMLLDVRLDSLDQWGPPHYLRLADQKRAVTTAPRPGPLRVALAWRGNRTQLVERSIPLERFADLGVDGVEWFSLQRELHPGPEADAARRMGLHHEGWNLDESAQAMPRMDLVVSVDTVFCHLAGSLGLPTRVLLPLACDWRWGTAESSNSPWYPNSVLLRQRRPGDWSDPLAELAACLRQRALASAAGTGEGILRGP